jgi:hypothetical protein
VRDLRDDANCQKKVNWFGVDLTLIGTFSGMLGGTGGGDCQDHRWYSSSPHFKFPSSSTLSLPCLSSGTLAGRALAN